MVPPDKSFFSFPDDKIRRHQWVLYCKSFNASFEWKRFKLTSTSMICSDHFKAECFVKNAGSLLKRTAVPTLTLHEMIYNRAVNLPVIKLDNIVFDTTEETDTNILFELKDQVSYSQLCRLCATICGDMIFIFGDEGLKQNSAEKINLCFPFDVTEHDYLPKQVCRSCLSNLNELFDLADMCSIAQEKLKNELRNPFSEILMSDTPQQCPLCMEGTMCIVDDIYSVCSTGTDSTEPKSDLTTSGCESNDHILSINDSEMKSLLNLSLENLSPSSFLFVETDEGDCYKFHSVVNQSDITKSSLFKIKTPQQISSEYIISPFSCRVCGEYFEKEDLIWHSYDHSCKYFYQCSLCKSSFSKEESFSAHLIDHQVNNSFSKLSLADDSNSALISTSSKMLECQVCCEIFPNESTLIKHLKVTHGSAICITCLMPFENDIQLKEHSIAAHHLLNGYHACDECGKLFKSKASKNYHKIMHHRNRKGNVNVCEFCGKSFIRRSMLMNHLSKFHISLANSPVECFTCKICYEGFPNKTSALAHMEVHKEQDANELVIDSEKVEKMFICEYCERYFNKENYLNYHRQNHQSNPLFECKICKAPFPNKENYDYHKVNNHDLIPIEYSYKFKVPLLYSCEYCERFFFHFNKYEEHLTIHFEEMPYNCRHCYLKFKSLPEAIVHRMEYPVDSQSIQSAYLPFACHFCSKRFHIEDVLTKHIRMHTGEKPFVCDQCGKGFSQSSGLYTHQKVHSSERPYSCSLCPRTFKIKGDRDVHERKHSGDRPYTCEVCGKAFMTQHVYSQHKKIHTGERPYKCDVCYSSFRRSHVLTVHKRIHTGEKPHICSFCGRCYRQKGDLLKHCRTQHIQKGLKQESMVTHNC